MLVKCGKRLLSFVAQCIINIESPDNFGSLHWKHALSHRKSIRESTTMLRLMEDFGLLQPIREMAQHGLAIWGTCAGMVLLAKDVSNYEMETLGLMDTEIERNAFGSQIDSFEIDLEAPLVGEEPFHAIFIRAPIIKAAKPHVEVLSRLPDGTIVAIRQNRLLACAFHPEFTDDLRFYSYFLKLVKCALSQNPAGEFLRIGQLRS